MALRFNPPPNWPAPPEGFVPPAGWQPDPAWGPAPEGWQLWVDDAADAPATAEDPAWAPTQAISSANVAHPTGSSASAPSAEPAPINGSAPMAASAPGAGATMQMPPVAPSAPGATAQMPPVAPATPYPGAGAPYAPSGAQPGGMPAQQPWQPMDPAGQNAAVPVTKKPWFIPAIAGAVVVLLLIIGGVVFLGGDDEKEAKESSSSSQKKDAEDSSEKKDEAKSDDDDAKKDDSAKEDKDSSTSGKKDDADSKKSSKDLGTTQDNPIDPTTSTITMKAGEYATDPTASVDITFGAVNWDAAADIEAQDPLFTPAPDGNVYMRVPVTIVYHGKGQMSSYDIELDYVKDGTSYSPEYIFTKDEIRSMDMPRDGGTVTGYYTYIIPSSDANSGVFALKYGFMNDEVYVAAK